MGFSRSGVRTAGLFGLLAAILLFGGSPASAQPANDECVNATAVGEGVFPFDNTGTLVDGPNNCDPNMSTDVWFLYTASSDGFATFETCATTGTLTDTTIIVYDGAVCPVDGDPFLACDDDSCGPTGFNSSAEVAVTMGSTYYVQVGGWNGTAGDGTLTISILGGEVDCFNGVDDDGDGDLDCADADCFVICDESINCADGIDNDGDGNIDCLDADCVGAFDCDESFNCGDGIDNDVDGDIDCFDTDCIGSFFCLEQFSCDDGIDNDMDGDIDCADADCMLDIACVPLAPNDECVNAVAVGDGLFTFNNINTPIDGPEDCDANMSTDVWFLYTAPLTGFVTIDTCQTVLTLTDTTMIIYDGATCPVPGDPFLACDDDSCGATGFNSSVTLPVMTGDTLLVQVGGWNGSTGEGTLSIVTVVAELNCFDGLDDDADGMADCLDPDCAVPCDESLNCADGVDNDGDLLTDCEDDDCAGDNDCDESLNCADGLDNDLDGLTDCADLDDCEFDPACVPLAVNDECVDATPIGEGDFVFNNINTPVDGPADCDGNMSTDVWFLYTASMDGTARISTCNTVGTLTDTTLIVYDGAMCPMAGDPFIDCDDDGCGPTNFNSQVVVPVLSGESFLVQVGGWNGTTGVGTVSVEFLETDCADGLDDDGDTLIDCADPDCATDAACIVSPPGAVTCVYDGVDTVTATWDAPMGGPGADSVNVFVDGVMVSNEPLTTLSWDVTVGMGFVGIVEVCLETVFGANVSDQACCSIGIGGPANDNCIDAIPAVVGDNPFSNFLGTLDGPADCDANMGADVWFEYTAVGDGDVTFETCNTLGALTDTVIIVYDASLGCPTAGSTFLACDDDDCGTTGFNSSVTVPMVTGDSVLVQVGGWNGANGDGTLTVDLSCGNIGMPTCSFDLGTNSLTINWTDNSNATMGYEIFENGVMVGTAPAGSSSFVLANPASGLNIYDVTWTCALGGVPGGAGSCSISILGQVPPGTNDLIIHNEGLLDGGDLGFVDSGAALEASLVALGRSVYRVAVADFDTSGLDFSIPQNVWLCLGSFPTDYSLSAAEADFIAALNAGGTGVYLEAGDHWGFLPVASTLDDRDGVAPFTPDGDDTLTSLSAQTGPLLDLSGTFPNPVAYTQDVLGTNDWNDQLTIATMDSEVDEAQAFWRNQDDTMTSEPDYIAAIGTTHLTGAPMIAASFEFGGLPSADRNTVAMEYLDFIGVVVPPTGGFVRGDCNADGTTNIADAIFLLGALFPGPSGPNFPTCESACENNDDGTLNIADAIFILSVLFPPVGTTGPTLPGPSTCGPDPTPDAVTCNAFTPCP